MKFNVIIACYNRQLLTLEALRLLYLAANNASVMLDVYLYDDASTDGTSLTVAELFPAVTIINGPGNAYWARSMAEAERRVLGSSAKVAEEYVVWLNDDVRLDADSFIRLVKMLRINPEAVLVGAMRDPSDGRVTYSGMKRAGLHPLNFIKLPPTTECLDIDTFNGNFVAVPLTVAHRLGGIDGEFSHALADIDYGLRARKLGIKTLLLPGTFGTCALNPPPPKASATAEWRRFVGVKGGGNFLSMRRALRKEAPLLWPAFMVTTYALWWFRYIVKNYKTLVWR